MPTDEFERSVFINCPFDADYLPLLRPLLFTLISCRFIPRIALERFDSGEVRLHKLIELVQNTRYSIHDLSRTKSSQPDEYYRLNMPFEVGLDLGCRLFHPASHLRAKRILILEGERFSYQRALSDLAGCDTKSHDHRPGDLVFEVRSWFAEVGVKNLPGGTQVWKDYNEFYADFFRKRMEAGYEMKDIDKMPIPEFLDFVTDWHSTAR